MKTLLFTAIVALSAMTTTTKAQTADDIINKYIQAIGGKDVLAKVKSIYSEGTATAMGNEFPTNTTLLAGKGFKSVTEINGTDLIQCYTGEGGWTVNPFAGQADPTPLPSDMAKRGKSAITVGGPLVDFKALGYTDSLVGKEMVNGANTYKIKLGQPGLSTMYYIDATTYYIVKSETAFSMNGEDVTNSSTFSDYKKTDIGLIVPYSVSLSNNGNDVSINYTTVTINKEIDPAIFVMPAK